MKLEVEQKFPVVNPVDLQRKLLALGAAPGEPIEQVDCYFAHPSRDFAQTDEAFRLRTIGERNYITYKGPKLDATTKTRRELELPIPDGRQAAEGFEALFAALGFTRVREVRKQRRAAEVSWQGQAVEVCLDDVDGLGAYVELELIVDDAGLDLARQCLASLASELGLSQPERRSYLELLFIQA